MKKIFQICAVFALIISATACSNSDNQPIRVPQERAGVWVTHELSYEVSFGGQDREMKHLFSEMPADDVADGEQITEEIITITKDNKVELQRIQKNGTQLEVIHAEIVGDFIHFSNDDFVERKIINANKTELTLEYNISMRGKTLPVTVTHNRK